MERADLIEKRKEAIKTPYTNENEICMRGFIKDLEELTEKPAVDIEAIMEDAIHTMYMSADGKTVYEAIYPWLLREVLEKHLTQKEVVREYEVLSIALQFTTGGECKAIECEEIDKEKMVYCVNCNTLMKTHKIWNVILHHCPLCWPNVNLLTP